MITNAQDQLKFIQRVIDATGPRLPGSAEERAGAEMIAEELERAAGSPAVVEPFDVHPHASIAFIPVLGYIGLFLILPLTFVAPGAALAISALLVAFTYIQVFRYRGWFDFLFPKRQSQNVYAIMEPASGQVDYTLIVSGHNDSAYFFKYFYTGHAAPRMVLAIASAFLIVPVALLRVLQAQGVITWAGEWTLVVALLLAPGFYFASQFISWSRDKASPGAADNLSGVVSAIHVADHFRTHPDQAPKNCRIIAIGFGAEEAGLKGSIAFVKKHRDDLLKGDVWMLNVDNVSDYDHFHVIDGDVWQQTRHDDDFCRLAEEAMQAAGVKYTRMMNPIGGTDCAPFVKAGMRATLLNAQDPGPSNRYHTFLDTPENIEEPALTKHNEIMLDLIARVDRFVHGKEEPNKAGP